MGTHRLAVPAGGTVFPWRSWGAGGSLRPRNRLCFGAPHHGACGTLGTGLARQALSPWLLLPLQASLGTKRRGFRLGWGGAGLGITPGTDRHGDRHRGQAQGTGRVNVLGGQMQGWLGGADAGRVCRPSLLRPCILTPTPTPTRESVAADAPCSRCPLRAGQGRGAEGSVSSRSLPGPG